jgi:hypothetical protein
MVQGTKQVTRAAIEFYGELATIVNPRSAWTLIVAFSSLVPSGSVHGVSEAV